MGLVQISDINGILLTAFYEVQNQLSSIANVQTEILKKVVSLETDVKHILSSSAQSCINLKSTIPEHPVANIVELTTLENWISDLATSENHDAMVRYLSIIGQGIVKESVYIILAKLFKNCFAESINCTGKNGKLEFQKSVLLAVVKEAVQLQAASASSATATSDNSSPTIKNPKRKKH